MRFKIFGLFLVSIAMLSSCKTSKNAYFSFSRPSQGESVVLGKSFEIKLDLPKDLPIDQVNFLIDGKHLKTLKDSTSFTLKTEDLKLGYRNLTAIINYQGKQDTITTNIVLKSDLKPQQIQYRLVNSFPHDTSAFTQGLSYVDGRLLESTGLNGRSVVKWVDLNSGKPFVVTPIDTAYFGEGSLKVGDKVIMLTWQHGLGLIFDAKTLKQKGTFPYQQSKEGWGLTYDGKSILKSDGTNRIWRLNAETLIEESFIEVYDNRGPLEELNELEYIGNRIFANVYTSNDIVIINPVNGQVEARIDLTALVPRKSFKTADEGLSKVLNGIAWDEKGQRLLVTGKQWPSISEIKLLNFNLK